MLVETLNPAQSINQSIGEPATTALQYSPDATRNKSAFAYIAMSLPQDDRQLMDGFQKDKENGIWFSVDRCLLG